MRKNVLLGISFLIPLLLIAIIFSFLSVTPFGNRNLLISDIGTQYLQFMYSFGSVFTKGISFYSFSNGLGDSTQALWSYYLMSPLNLISLLFQKENLTTALVWIIMIKVSLIGLSMCYYLHKHYRETSFSMVLFSSAYSFTGFVGAYSFNYMWLDALILLPLVVLGLESLWEGKRGVLFCSTLFLTILTNYYLGYMVCLFSLIYSFYLYTLKYDKGKDWRFKIWINRWKRYLLCLIFTSLATSFVLLPAFLEMLKTPKTNFSLSSIFSLFPNFLFSIFSQLGIGSIHYSHRLENLPVIYSGILVVLFVIIYFFSRKITKREKKITFSLIFVCFLSMMFEPFNVLWHMFQSPAGFPYRNSFIVSFLLISFAYKGFSKWQNEQEFKVCQKHLLRATSIGAILLLIGFLSVDIENHIFNAHHFSGKERIGYLALTLVFLCFYSGLLAFWRRKNRRFLLLFVSLFFLTEIGLNLYISLKDIYYGNQSSYSHSYKKIDRFIQNLNDKKQLVRMGENISGSKLGYDVPYYNYNDSYMFDFSGISSYTSTLKKDTINTMKNLGAYSKNERRFSIIEANPILNLLLNIKYNIYSEKMEKQAGPIKNSDLYAYQNKEAIGAGFFVQNNEVKMKNGEVFKNLEKVLQGILPTEKSYLREATLLSAENNSEITLRSNTTGELMMFWPDMNWSGVKYLTVNGKIHKPNLEIETNQLVRLGYFPKGAVIKVHIQGLKEKISPKPNMFYSLDQSQFDTLITQKRKTAIQLKKRDDSHLISEIKPSSHARTLFLSIPYDRSWKVKVDGKNVETQKAFDNFTCVRIPAYAREISLTYKSTVFTYGFLLSFISLITGILLNRRRKI